MPTRPTTDVLITDADVTGTLAELNAADAGMQGLRGWEARSDIKTHRVIEGPDITDVRLAGHTAQGGVVVLMHMDRTWDRAI